MYTQDPLGSLDPTTVIAKRQDAAPNALRYEISDVVFAQFQTELLHEVRLYRRDIAAIINKQQRPEGWEQSSHAKRSTCCVLTRDDNLTRRRHPEQARSNTAAHCQTHGSDSGGGLWCVHSGGSSSAHLA